MLRLIIADDERIIRETISSLIDWNSLGIELVATCSNGLDAYDAILDEYPDIVLTDIKMPGLSGLELIHKLHQVGGNTEFIILSGYGEFSLAAEAMKYGVKHYLLKPCNEEEIIAAVRDAAQTCRARRVDAVAAFRAPARLQRNLLRSILVEGLCSHTPPEKLLTPYRQMTPLGGSAYCLQYVYFLEEKNLHRYLARLEAFYAAQGGAFSPISLYVTNTLVLFYPQDAPEGAAFSAFLQGLTLPEQTVALTQQTLVFPSLSALLGTLLVKIGRFSTIYFIDEQQITPICNYTSILQQASAYAAQLASSRSEETREESLRALTLLLSGIDDPAFLTTVLTHLLSATAQAKESAGALQISEFLFEIGDLVDCEAIRACFFRLFPQLFSKNPADSSKSDFIESTMQYIRAHIDDPSLSLKNIAEGYLYMNVDYVSKQFVRQTGEKFSTYLNALRIQKAKQLLLEFHGEKIYSIAEKVGCGNNPQYFSQWFKKHTGVSPTAYLHQHS